LDDRREARAEGGRRFQREGVTRITMEAGDIASAFKAELGLKAEGVKAVEKELPS